MEEDFIWTRTWYPMCNEADLELHKPTPVTLLGRNMVLFRDNSSEWNCLEDVCPHRLAPLSEGRVEEGMLQCAYHGWCFNGLGNCQKIPQIQDASAEATALKSQRSCVKSFPVTVQCGLVWIWPEAVASETVHERPFIPKPLQEYFGAELEAGRGTPSFFVRDLPYGHDILLENLLDPSHLPFSHHGLGSLNRSLVEGHGMKLLNLEHELCDIDSVSGYTPTICSTTQSMFGPPGNMSGVLEFKAPHFAGYRYELSSNKYSHVIIFAVPTKIGYSRALLINIFPGALQGIKGKLFNFLKTVFKYRLHDIDNTIFDGDGVFLAIQQNQLYQQGDTANSPEGTGMNRWKQRYFCPSQADAMVIAMRKWYDRHGVNGQPPWAFGSGVQIPLNRNITQEESLDRYQQHTQHCGTCKQALKRLSQLKIILLTLAGLSGIALFAACVQGSPLVVKGLCMLGIAVFFKMWSIVQAEMRMFYFVGYDHSLRD